MKQILIAVFLVLTVSVRLSYQQCDATNCIAPLCKCKSTNPPGGLTPDQTPQLVFLSFDGAITKTAIGDYTTVLSGRTNPNGCPISATFFVNHEYNDYNLTNGLFNQGHEIATSSISHAIPAADWAIKPKSEWIDEIGGMRTVISTFANIPASNIRTARSPFLQSSGDQTIEAMVDTGTFYDCSYPTTANNPAIFPYTLDQGFQHDCQIPPCPSTTGRYPGVWTVPMVVLKDINGTVCAMADGCDSGPQNRAETLDYLKRNFNNVYTVNRAPFGVYLLANQWFSYEGVLDGYQDFLDYLMSLPDVYIVSIGKGLDWMKNPLPESQAGLPGNPLHCPTITRQPCSPRTCGFDENSSPIGPRNMVSCITCPDFYPWTGNPTGSA